MRFDPSAQIPEETLRLAEKILLYSRRYITQKAPLMLAPIYALRQVPLPVSAPMATDGTRLYYSPEQVIADFQKDRTAPARQLLHATLHCLLGHLKARPQEEDVGVFDQAADLKAAQFARALSPELCPGKRDLDADLSELPFPLAVLCSRVREDPYYRRLMDQAIRTHKLRLDDHALWNSPAGQRLRPGADGGEGAGERSLLCLGQSIDPGTGEGPAPNWEQMLRDLDRQTEKNPAWGDIAGMIRQYLPAEENQISYSAFLRRFAVPNERLLLDPDSFDPRWYYLGLEQYGNVPLLEPSELSEPPLPDDIVLALDTSGSCNGDVCRRFLRETLSLLRDISAGTPRFHVLALQCDTKIQKELLLEDAGQLEHFLEDFTPRGFGGTDFRPVFERVEQLRQEGALPRVRGLLYLSDGCGCFPEGPPDYPVTFLILQDKDQWFQPNIPDWVNVLYLDADHFTLKEASA